ncbi:MAG: hypothetical protein KAI79_12750 [Bacteroidales bacterium]|nr:hypothetical protein [Bacteroidales bacterium]
MKNLRTYLLFIAITIFSFVACETDEEVNDGSVNLPDKFSVNIPASISNSSGTKYASADTLKGAELYEHLRTFVAIGEFSAQFIEEIMGGINTYNLAQSLSTTFTGDDDRTKSLVVQENVTFEGINYAFGLTVKDGDDYAMQVFWNNEPVKGTAIVSLYNIDTRTDPIYKDTKYRVDYSEAGEMGYDEHMIVYITDYPIIDRFGLNNLKMFVGKTGNEVEVFGNSNHPDMWLFAPDVSGYDWAFVARANIENNISVAQVALPPMTLETVEGIFDTYSFKTIISDEIHRLYDSEWGELLVSLYLEGVLEDANSPAYFNNGGFVSSGDNIPDGFSSEFVDLSSLSPYIPVDIMNLSISFVAEASAK